MPRLGVRVVTRLSCGWVALATAFLGCGVPAPQRVDAIPHAVPPQQPRADPTLAGRPPTRAEAMSIKRLQRIAEEARGLRFESEVPVRIQNRAEILAHVFRELEEDDLEDKRQLYVALGLLPADMDVREILERVLGEQIAGYYDQDDNHLVIRDEIIRSLGAPQLGAFEEAHVTIIHELVHALQDQHLALGQAFADGDEVPSDPESAYQAVVEGDATLAMVGFISAQAGAPLSLLTSNPTNLRRFMAQARDGRQDPELSGAPAILRVTLLSSYLDGLLFCSALHGRGGWRAVNEAHRAPPISTEQVLHPQRYLSGELPDEVAVPSFDSLQAAGLRRFDTDQLGELELRVYFGQLTDGVDEAAADGWSGDEIAAYRSSEGEVSIVWFTAWDNREEAEEAALAANLVLHSVPAAARSRYSVTRSGRAVLIIRNLPGPLHASVDASFRRFASALPPEPPRTGGAP